MSQVIDNVLTTYAADGTPIAYNVVGQGPAIVFANGYTTSNFFWWAIHERFRGHFKLVTFDYKGHGRSGPARSRGGADMASLADDMRRVMDAAGVEHGTLAGFSMGSQVILEAWRHFPDRIDALISVLGTYQAMLDTVFHPRLGATIHGALRNTGPRRFTVLHHTVHALLRIPAAHRVGRALKIAGPVAPQRDLDRYIAHFGKVHPPTVRGIGLRAQKHSARDLLPTITAPTLIVVGGQDVFAPAYLGEEMHALIPDSDLLHLPEATHMGLVEFPDAIGDAMEHFLRSHELLTD